MSERAAYSRVYWSIIDDPKFANVYDDDRALAAWLRLLLVADQAWPASAHLPGNVRRQAVAVLVGSGLVDLLHGGRYRIHGLDAERQRRKEAATRNPTGTQQGPNRDPNGLSTPGLRRDEKETRRDEPSETRAPVMVVIDYLEERTGRPYTFGAGSTVHETLTADVRDFGETPVLEAMRTDATKYPDIGQLVFGASRLLHPIGPQKPAEPDPEWVAKQIAEQREARRKERASA